MGRAAATETECVTGGVVLGRAPDEQAATRMEADAVHASSGRNRKLRENGGSAEVMDCFGVCRPDGMRRANCPGDRQSMTSVAS